MGGEDMRQELQEDRRAGDRESSSRVFDWAMKKMNDWTLLAAQQMGVWGHRRLWEALPSQNRNRRI
jgi:hypothetical protein